jgi:hypothetical protein
MTLEDAKVGQHEGGNSLLPTNCHGRISRSQRTSMRNQELDGCTAVISCGPHCRSCSASVRIAGWSKAGLSQQISQRRTLPRVETSGRDEHIELASERKLCIPPFDAAVAPMKIRDPPTDQDEIREIWAECAKDAAQARLERPALFVRCIWSAIGHPAIKRW